jgi:hypothetical protein
MCRIIEACCRLTGGLNPSPAMKKRFPHRMVRLEKDLWRIRSDQGELEAAEQQELRLYFDEVHSQCWDVDWRVTLAV